MVQNRDLTVSYQIHNAGAMPAFDVELSDAHSFSLSLFEPVSGTFDARWAEIAPGANASHVVVVRPRAAAMPAFKSQAARLSYRAAGPRSEKGASRRLSCPRPHPLTLTPRPRNSRVFISSLSLSLSLLK